MRASETAFCHPLSVLVALNRDVEHVPLPVDEQEREVGRFQRIGQTLKDREAADILPVEFQHHITRL